MIILTCRQVNILETLKFVVKDIIEWNLNRNEIYGLDFELDIDVFLVILHYLFVLNPFNDRSFRIGK